MDREKALKVLLNHVVPDIRLLFKQLKGASVLVAYGSNVLVDTDHTGEGVRDQRVYNPSWEALNYPGPYPETKRVNANDVWKPDFIDIDLEAKGTFNARLECDIVVVGSGAGGGVLGILYPLIIAAELSKEGNKVILVEKGEYVHPSDFTLNESEAYSNLFERGAAFYSEDGAIQTVAGSVWGGGTTVNWYMSQDLI
jgi:hypothetical protein